MTRKSEVVQDYAKMEEVLDDDKAVVQTDGKEDVQDDTGTILPFFMSSLFPIL